MIKLSGAVAIASFLFLNFTGFCYKHFRYYTKPALITIAINYNLGKHDPAGERRKIYGSIDEFHRINPYCCYAYPNAGIFDMIFGFYDIVAEIWYRIKDLGPDAFYLAYVHMNACGEHPRSQGILTSEGPRHPPPY